MIERILAFLRGDDEDDNPGGVLRWAVCTTLMSPANGTVLNVRVA
jgi:hypothetical protein